MYLLMIYNGFYYDGHKYKFDPITRDIGEAMKFETIHDAIQARKYLYERLPCVYGDGEGLVKPSIIDPNFQIQIDPETGRPY